MSPNDIANMADFVARAIYASCFEGSDEPFDSFDELDDVVRGNYLAGTYAAMGAHDAWLTTHGWAIVKVKRPTKKPGLILPEKPRLVGAA